MDKIVVVLGKKTYEVSRLSIRRSREIREKFSEMLSGPINSLKSVVTSPVTDVQGIASIVDSIRGLAATYIDDLLDLLSDISPEIEADRDEIEETGTDEEVISAVGEVLVLLFPFEKLLSGFTKIGHSDNLTSTNSSSASTVVGKKTSTRRR